MKLPLGDHRNVWSSLAAKTACIAMMLSPPGRLSMITGCPHFLCEALLDQPRADVRTGAGPERDDQPDRSLRPTLRLHLAGHGEEDQASENADGGGNSERVERIRFPPAAFAPQG